MSRNCQQCGYLWRTMKLELNSQLDRKSGWTAHIDCLSKRLTSSVRRLLHYISLEVVKTTCYSVFCEVIAYYIAVWSYIIKIEETGRSSLENLIFTNIYWKNKIFYKIPKIKFNEIWYTVLIYQTYLNKIN